jgi:small subunit ribosomal protein S6
MKLYEGLFLVDSADAAADWSAVTGAVEKILSRADAEVVSLHKWDERKLAYDVNGKGRGTYILTYFKCEPGRITAIERDVQLSEQILRVMVLTTEKMSESDISKDTPAALMAKAAVAAEAKAAEKAAAEAEAQAVAEAEAAEKAATEAETEVAAEAEAKSEPDESSADADVPSDDAVAEPEESSDDSAVEPAESEKTSEESPEEDE